MTRLVVLVSPGVLNSMLLIRIAQWTCLSSRLAGLHQIEAGRSIYTSQHTPLSRFAVDDKQGVSVSHSVSPPYLVNCAIAASASSPVSIAPTLVALDKLKSLRLVS